MVRSSQSFADYKSDAAAIDASANPKASVNESTAQNVIPNYGAAAPQSGYYNNPTAMDADSQKEMQTNDAGKTAKSAFDNKGDYNLSYLPKDNSSKFNVSSVIKLFTGVYHDCQPSTTDNPTLYDTITCDQYYSAKDNICQVPRRIDVESIFNYTCTKDLTYTSKTCNISLNLTCEEYNYAFPPTTHNSLPNFSYSSFSLKYRTPNRMGQNCGGYNYYWRFNLNSVAQVEEFKFLWAQADDRTMIYINGNLVHNYPSSGCELGRTYYSAPNIDLKPYLRAGNNELNVRIIVGGLGEGMGEFRLKYKECKKPVEAWQEVCQ